MVSFSCLDRAFRRSHRKPPPSDQVTEWESPEEHGISNVSSEPESEERRVVRHETIRSRQPTTDIFFDERRIGEGHLPSDVDEREITTEWKPYFTEAEKTRLKIYEQTPDLEHVARGFKEGFDALRGQSADRQDLSELVKRDKFSQAGKRFQTAIRSLVAGASMRGIPRDAACTVTINIAATPELPVWLAAGGDSPRSLKDEANRLYREALEEIGCKHLLRDGFLEIAMAENINLSNKKAAAFVKSFASTRWPSGLKLEDHRDAIAIAHTHETVVLLDEKGLPIAPKLLKKALKKRFPSKRAVFVKRLGRSRRTRSMSLSKAAEAAIKYALERKKGRREWELCEQARWADELEPEDLWVTGWTSFVNVRVMSVPIMRASVLSRQKLREALVDVEIGRGWIGPSAVEPIRASPSRPSNVIRLRDYRRLHRATRRSMVFIVSNDNELPVGARAGPDRRTA